MFQDPLEGAENDLTGDILNDDAFLADEFDDAGVIGDTPSETGSLGDLIRDEDPEALEEDPEEDDTTDPFDFI